MVADEEDDAGSSLSLIITLLLLRLGLLLLLLPRTTVVSISFNELLSLLGDLGLLRVETMVLINGMENGPNLVPLFPPLPPFPPLLLILGLILLTPFASGWS